MEHYHGNSKWDPVCINYKCKLFPKSSPKLRFDKCEYILDINNVICSRFMELHMHQSNTHSLEPLRTLSWCYKVKYSIIHNVCVYFYLRYKAFQKTKETACTELYSICFLMYGSMMTSAMVADSLLAAVQTAFWSSVQGNNRINS